jgi:hypothetical protein
MGATFRLSTVVMWIARAGRLLAGAKRAEHTEKALRATIEALELTIQAQEAMAQGLRQLMREEDEDGDARPIPDVADGDRQHANG